MREPNEGELDRARDPGNRAYVILKWHEDAWDGINWIAVRHSRTREEAMMTVRYLVVLGGAGAYRLVHNPHPRQGSGGRYA